MIVVSTEHGFTCTTNTENGRATHTRPNNGGTTVYFGFSYDGRFNCSHSTPSREYKTEGGVTRAVARWTA